MILFITSLVLGVFFAGYTIYQVVRLIKQATIGGEKFVINQELLVKYLQFILAQGCLTIASSYGLVLNGGWHLEVFEHFLLIFGSYFFGSGFVFGLACFMIRYYRVGVEEHERHQLKLGVIIGAVAFVIGIYLLSTAVADYIKYPLVNGFSFKNGFKYMTPGVEAGVLWYGVLIVGGTLVAYFIADHIAYKQYHRHGVFEAIAVVGFISGILGARLWSCLVLEFDYYKEHVGEIFKIWEGGLAIQGGLFLGCAITIPYILLFKKNISPRYVIDVALPCILIAQAIGRWGNFFNREVYGVAVSADTMKLFPKIIANNMYIDGEYHLPLFFIESLINVGGFFVLRYAVGRGLKRWIGLGDIGASYIIWYGLTRVALEPLRDGFTTGDHESGFGYMQSWITAFIMIGVGILLIVVFHLYDYLKNKKQNIGVEAQ